MESLDCLIALSENILNKQKAGMIISLPFITRQVYACRAFLYTGIFKCCSKTISEDNGLDFSVVDHNVINNTDNESL